MIVKDPTAWGSIRGGNCAVPRSRRHHLDHHRVDDQNQSEVLEIMQLGLLRRPKTESKSVLRGSTRHAGVSESKGPRALPSNSSIRVVPRQTVMRQLHERKNLE
jgi:hypothetical protein